MRKALMAFVLAATVLTPIAAQAQDRGGRQRASEQARSERSAPRGAVRQQRQATRAENRSENRGNRERARGENRQAAPAPAPPPAQARRGNRQAAPAPVQVRGANRSVQRVQVDRRQGQVSRSPVRRVGQDQRARPRQQSIYPQAWQGNRNDPKLRHYQELERRNQAQGRRDRRDDRRDYRQDRRDDRRDYRQDRREDRRDWRREWNRQSWRSDRRYNWQDYRYRNRNQYRLPSYYSPYRNHRYSRFSIGLHLQPLFYSQRYWIGDPWQYRLPAAPHGTQWVRYYDDVILVDTYTGEVVDVIYDFFW